MFVTNDYLRFASAYHTLAMERYMSSDYDLAFCHKKSELLCILKAELLLHSYSYRDELDLGFDDLYRLIYLFQRISDNHNIDDLLEQASEIQNHWRYNESQYDIMCNLCKQLLLHANHDINIHVNVKHNKRYLERCLLSYIEHRTSKYVANAFAMLPYQDVSTLLNEVIVDGICDNRFDELLGKDNESYV